jgi:hypothetical protein
MAVDEEDGRDGGTRPHDSACTGGTGVAVAARQQTVHRLSGRLLELLDEIAGASLVGMSAAEAGEAAVELTVAGARLTALRLAALAQADRTDVAATVDATSTTGWLRSRLPVTAPAAARDLRLARTLDAERHRATSAALAAGHVLADQAAVIAAAVDDLPVSVTDAERRKAEEQLLGEARHHDARALTALARHLLEVIDPDLAEAELARRLDAEEAAAARATSFAMATDGSGRTTGRFVVPDAVAAMLRTQLQALANPHRPDPIARVEADGSKRPRPVVLGEAFVAYVERYPVDRLPETGGVAATVVVTVPLETLEGRLGCGQLLGPPRTLLSAAAARRLACTAGVVPAVLGTDGQVLDQGRRARTATKAQRLALTVQQDGVCGIEDCGAPAAWCDAHHWRGRWTDGARTDLRDLVLVCPRHHTLAHLPGRHLEQLSVGRFRLVRRDRPPDVHPPP